MPLLSTSVFSRSFSAEFAEDAGFKLMFGAPYLPPAGYSKCWGSPIDSRCLSRVGVPEKGAVMVGFPFRDRVRELEPCRRGSALLVLVIRRRSRADRRPL